MNAKDIKSDSGLPTPEQLERMAAIAALFRARIDQQSEQFREIAARIVLDTDFWRAQLAGIADLAATSMKAIVETVSTMDFRPFAEAAARLATLPPTIEKIQVGLASRGWFVINEMPMDEYLSLERHIDAGNWGEVDQTMSEWTEGLVPDTQAQLYESFPERIPLIEEGIQNFHDGRYASAITLLLTQADGICRDLLGTVFFRIRPNTQEPYIAQAINDLDLNVLAQMTLMPVLIKSGINANDNDVAAGQYPDSPHRHRILHGTCTDYATRLNALKVISFIGFMGIFVGSVVREASEAIEV